MGRTFWLSPDEHKGQELEKPLGFSFPQLTTKTKASVFTGSLVVFRIHSTSRAVEKLGDNYKAREATGRVGLQPPGRLQGARPRCTRARGALKPPASRCRAWQLREGSRSAQPPDFSRVPAPAGPATRPNHPRLSRGVRGPTPPELLGCRAPSAPGPWRAAQVESPALPASAPTTHTHSRLPTSRLGDASQLFSILKDHTVDAPGAQLPARRQTPALASREPAHPARELRALLPNTAPRPARRQTPYLGGLHFRSRRHI